jgi:hypothetical protein
MILYYVGLVIAFVGWALATGSLTSLAFDEHEPNRAEVVKYARLAWLSFFLLPLYPAVICVVLVVGPIMIFRRLGRINKEDNE